MKEYVLLLITDKNETHDYLSNKELITSGDLIFIDGLTVSYTNAIELGKRKDNHNNYLNATIISKDDYQKLNNKRRIQPKEEIVLFKQEGEELIENLFNTSEPPTTYINYLTEKYKEKFKISTEIELPATYEQIRKMYIEINNINRR